VFSEGNITARLMQELVPNQGELEIHARRSRSDFENLNNKKISISKLPDIDLFKD